MPNPTTGQVAFRCESICAKFNDSRLHAVEVTELELERNLSRIEGVDGASWKGTSKREMQRAVYGSLSRDKTPRRRPFCSGCGHFSVVHSRFAFSTSPSAIKIHANAIIYRYRSLNPYLKMAMR